MASSLSDLVDNLAERIHKIRCKYGHDKEQCETCGIKYKDCNSCLECTNAKDDLIEYKCLFCNKNYQKTFDENLKKQFVSTYKFSNRDINKFILLLRKGVYPYEYMDDWKKLNETSLPEKVGFYSHLTMKDITDADYTRAKRFCKDFEIKNLGEYDDFYFQSDTSLLAEIFNNFPKMCLEINELDPGCFLSVPALIWQTALKKTEVKLELLTNIDILLMVENCIRGEICHAIHRFAKADNKYTKDYDKDEKCYLKY